MRLFDVGSFSGDERGWRTALTEALAEVGALKASLRASFERETILRKRIELLEGAQRTSYKMGATIRR